MGLSDCEDPLITENSLGMPFPCGQETHRTLKPGGRRFDRSCQDAALDRGWADVGTRVRTPASRTMQVPGYLVVLTLGSDDDRHGAVVANRHTLINVGRTFAEANSPMDEAASGTS